MPTVEHIDISADDIKRAREFYESLFDWKMQAPQGMTDYYLFTSSGLKGQTGVGGGLGQRSFPGQTIINYIGVNSVDEYAEKVKKLGGKIVQPKMAVQGMGYMVVCSDTENNLFGLWQDDPNAK